VTATDTRRETGVSVHAIYPYLSYEIEVMPQYFATFAAVWDASLRLINYRYRPVTRRRAVTADQRVQERVWIPTQQQPELHVHRLGIGSPMEVTFALEGGTAVLGTYAVYLFARVLRSPEDIGSWLPRVVSGWRRGWKEAQAQRTEDEGDQKPAMELGTKAIPKRLVAARDLIKASEGLLELGMVADEVRMAGVDHLPADLADSGTP
jgi:hypothetical protein